MGRRASSVVVRAAPKPGVDGVPYVAKNTFVIPDHDPAVAARFEEEMHHREHLMKSLPGFTHCSLVKDKNEYTFSQEWETKQAGPGGAGVDPCWSTRRLPTTTRHLSTGR